MRVADFPGPLTVIPGGAPEELVTLAAAICAGYGKAPADKPVTVQVAGPMGTRSVEVLAIAPAQTHRFLIQ